MGRSLRNEQKNPLQAEYPRREWGSGRTGGLGGNRAEKVAAPDERRGRRNADRCASLVRWRGVPSAGVHGGRCVKRMCGPLANVGVCRSLAGRLFGLPDRGLQQRQDGTTGLKTHGGGRIVGLGSLGGMGREKIP